VDVWVPWLQSLLAIALAFAAAAFGRRISRFRWWPLASIAACGLIGCIGAARWFPRLELMPPFAWLTHGRTEYMLLAPLVAIGIFARAKFAMNYVELSGLLAGSMTDPPALAFANDICHCDAPAVAYAAVYPLTMLSRIMVAQFLVVVLCG